MNFASQLSFFQPATAERLIAYLLPDSSGAALPRKVPSILTMLPFVRRRTLLQLTSVLRKERQPSFLLSERNVSNQRPLGALNSYFPVTLSQKVNSCSGSFNSSDSNVLFFQKAYPGTSAKLELKQLTTSAVVTSTPNLRSF